MELLDVIYRAGVSYDGTNIFINGTRIRILSKTDVETLSEDELLTMFE